MNRVAVCLMALVALLATPLCLHADSLQPVPSGPSLPNGYWSFKNAQSPASSLPLTFSGNGQMMIGTELNASSPMVFVDLSWQPDEFTIGPGYGSAIFSWTALSAGEYTVTATDAPSQGFGSSPLGQAAGSSQSGLFTKCISFNPGDSICFVLPTAGNDSDFVFIGPVTVPEPSRAVALLGIVGSLVCIVAIVAGRRKKLAAMAVAVRQPALRVSGL